MRTFVLGLLAVVASVGAAHAAAQDAITGSAATGSVATGGVLQTRPHAQLTLSVRRPLIVEEKKKGEPRPPRPAPGPRDGGDGDR